MSVSAHACHSPVPTKDSVLSVAVARVSSALAAMAREIRVRHDLRQLAGADEAMLHDIGLSRGEIDCAVRCGRPR